MSDCASQGSAKSLLALEAPSGPSLPQLAAEFTRQALKLSHEPPSSDAPHPDLAVEARFVTPHDPVIITSAGHRLPSVPAREAHKLNVLREEVEHAPHAAQDRHASHLGGNDARYLVEENSTSSTKPNGQPSPKRHNAPLRRQLPPSHTNPLFPPLPLYGPSSPLRDVQYAIFRLSSFVLSLAFLSVIVLGALFTSIPPFAQKVYRLLTFRNIEETRPFLEEETKRKKIRKSMERAWERGELRENPDRDCERLTEEYRPTEGGPDPVVCDPAYYARRVGLDLEEFQVETEDGFIIDLWHVYDPKEYTRLEDEDRQNMGPMIFPKASRNRPSDAKGKPKFPVLLIPGLLQSAGAYLSNDDDSLAFYLCKSGYDVWLGNNRGGFKPKHRVLEESDPRMWCWNIRQMGVFDLPALTSRVLYETGFEKIGLICHSQGTTEAFVALAKEQRPELGERLTVFCALAPAAYAGPLIGKMYFKFMRIITPGMFRLMFGLRAFIGFMMTMHSHLPPRLYGWLGYKVFSFLFDWSDKRWDRGLRDRLFRFAPVYVSAESMRWWLGRECFARHKCILATKEAVRAEEKEDHVGGGDGRHSLGANEANDDGQAMEQSANQQPRKPRGSTAWYNDQAPPFALWVAGSDDLVDGRKLLRRLERGREPHVNVVHSKVIPEYEHLDVIWAMDAPDKVFREIKEVLWKTCHARDMCRVPRGCEDVQPWSPDSRSKPDEDLEEELSSSENS
ncbi:sterol esterase [Sodiomyces alkalinus F11]|uniref:Sterol esterase n=1 Tax=Sodiomyces alkalinus (strain CBS 110278 / VKM F-3762 / F11) TaxID=1314773 RepID=A0A3N2PYZ3_SODAK|nr:sterol esterase [Sodiomyces alkalinus F11]ROT39717.1 sterol esterase [Sodiomyces alkalinus F11]